MSAILNELKHISRELRGSEAGLAAVKKRQNRISPLWQHYDENIIAEEKQGEGDTRLSQLLNYIAEFPLKPWGAQWRFIREFVNACLPLVYKDEWDSCRARVMQERRIETMMKEVMVNASRQVGKTTTVGKVVAALLLAVPGIKIGIFSTGDRASNNVLKAVVKNIKSIKGADRRIVKETSEFLYISEHPLPEGLSSSSAIAKQLHDDPGTAQLMSFPNNPTGTF